MRNLPAHIEAQDRAITKRKERKKEANILLQLTNELMKLNLMKTEADIQEILIYLSSEKFAGAGNNFVNASEMFNKLIEIRNNIKY